MKDKTKFTQSNYLERYPEFLDSLELGDIIFDDLTFTNVRLLERIGGAFRVESAYLGGMREGWEISPKKEGENE